MERFSYGTYGELLKDPITKIRFLYNGSYGVATDSNGLYYMRARYYNPDIKRFINQDIKAGDIGNSQSLNRYAYCEGNPVSMVDPFGLCGENTHDQGQKSRYQFWHNLLGVGGIFWDGFDLINGALYAMEGDYVNAAISFACGIPAVGNVIAGVAKASKAVKAIQTAEKIAGACRTVGKIGNTAAGVKAVYDTYQTAQQECKTTGGKIAYIAGTLAAGYAMGKAANWAAGKIKNLASKAMPKLKTAVKEAAGKLASRFNKGFGSSTSGHMSRNRGFAVNPFYKGDSITSFADMMSPEEAARYEAYWKRNAPNYNTPNSKIMHYKEHNGVIEKSTVIYDDFGRQKWRIDYNNHGYSNHSIPHLHEREYSPGYDPVKGKETRYDIWN